MIKIFKSENLSEDLLGLPKSLVHLRKAPINAEMNIPSDLANKECGDSEYFVEYLNKHERMLFFKISYNKLNFLLVPIHFPSRLFATTGKQKDLSVHFKNYIEKMERKYKLKSIVVGDFNMNPFEAGMIHQEGFYALPTQHLENIIKFYDILDDFGIQPFDNQSRSSLMEIIEDRHGKRSTIITSQLPVVQWHEIIGENTIADAILDRIVHQAHRIELSGESMRKRNNKSLLSLVETD